MSQYQGQYGPGQASGYGQVPASQPASMYNGQSIHGRYLQEVNMFTS